MKPTPLQRGYLKFIRDYVAVHREAPAEADMEKFFQVSPPAVHRMVVALTEKGLITRVPGQARSIRLVGEHVPEEDTEEALPIRPHGEIYAPLDPEIAPLVGALRGDGGVLTMGSCWGHGKEPAYVDLAVEGIAGLHMFVERLNQVDREVGPEAILDVALNWSHEVATACAFEVFPNWIMLSLKIEGVGRNGAPSAALLKRIAMHWGKGR